MAVSLAAVHPFHRGRPADARVPREKRHAEPCAIAGGLIEPLAAQSVLDWRGIVIAFVWKQAPFVTLLLAGAMASIDRQHIEPRATSAPRDCACCSRSCCRRSREPAGRRRAVVRHDAVGAVGAADDQPNAPTMITVDIAYRINTHGDYGVANALCLASLALAAAGAWFYLHHTVGGSDA